MKPVFQTLFDCDNGNCLSAAVASILELPLEDVPDFARIFGEAYEEAVVVWLRERKLRFLEMGFAQYETFCGTYFDCPGEFCIIAGPSTYPDRSHAVVGVVNERGGIDLAHDPMPGGSGPLPGYRWVRFIVPILSRA